MWIIFLVNTLVGFLIFIISAIVAGFLFNLTIGLWSNFQAIFFIPCLLVSLIMFYLLLLCLAIFYCRVFTYLLKQKTGTFPNNSPVQLLRITGDVLTSYLAAPLYPSMPFLIPLMGAVVGKNLAFSGKVFNADLLELGNNVLIGEDAFLTGHLQHANKFILGKIQIGSDVTIGMRSLILPDVEIGDRVIIASHAVVKIGTKIPPDEIWGGVPAKKIGERKTEFSEGINL
jgi:hypothetical protein